MSALSTIYDEIGTQIRTALSGAPWDFQVEPRMIVNPTPPAVDVYKGPVDPNELRAFGATAADVVGSKVVNVRVRVGTQDSEANQEIILALCDEESDYSIVQALYDDPTLNGHVTDIELISESELVLVPNLDGGAVHLGVIWQFLLIPARS